MKKIATINGVEVYSDKVANNIYNTRIDFMDGSWCDVATQQIVNKGNGSISFGKPGDGVSSSKIKKGPTAFKAQSLRVLDITADVEIVVGKEITLTVEGSESDVNYIYSSMIRDELVVQSKGGDRESVTSIGGNRSIHIGSIGGTSIVLTGNVQISMGSGEGQTKVRITVPEGTPVTVQSVRGKTTIGDTRGPIIISSSGSHEFEVGRVLDTNIELSGSGEVIVKEVAGDLTVTMSGSSTVEVKGGDVKKLNITTSGSGEVKFMGCAQDARIIASGSSDIYVAKVKNRPHVQSMGSSDISVGNW